MFVTTVVNTPVAAIMMLMSMLVSIDGSIAGVGMLSRCCYSRGM